MGEPKRVLDDNVTAAELGEPMETYRETERRPSLLRDERRDSATTPTMPGSRGEEAIDPSERATPPKGVPIPLTRGDAVEVGPETPPADDRPTALFSEAEIADFRSRWSDVQTGFVDEPRQAVEDADNLVDSLMKKLTAGFASERERLEKQWDRGDKVSTEDLRIALRRYRSFFDRLLRV
jgi:hypothetical protein